MPKIKYKIPSNFEDLELQELQILVKKYGDAANTRIRRLTKANILTDTPAYKIIIEPRITVDKRMNPYFTSTGRFSLTTKNKSKEYLINEIETIDRFLRAKTSTTAGYKQYTNKVLTAVSDSLNKKAEEVKDEVDKENLRQLAKEIQEVYDTKTSSEITDWWESSALSMLVHMYGSSNAIKIRDEIRDDVKSDERNKETVTVGMTKIDKMIVDFITKNKFNGKNKPPIEEFVDLCSQDIKARVFSSITDSKSKLDI